ncbi:MAG: RsmB/NOP family class I SAM-dependent RNA methyltransferase [Opitutus sp.]|nr:RsmB/NOP family class I SAM-dependent RNA methyltransferase [Opitutus sp.]
MSLAGSQQKVFLRLLAALRPNWHSDANLPAGIAELFAANRSFGSRDRRLYRELIYTTLRFLPWIEPLLDSDPARAAQVVAWLAADLPATHAYRAATSGDWPPCPPTVAAKAAHLGTDTGTLLPAWVGRHCAEAAVAPDLNALHTRASLWLRLQAPETARVLGEFARLGWASRQSKILPEAIELLAEADVTKTEAFLHGLVEVQDLGSQLILESVGLTPGDRWLDACAGAGGKTLQLARLLGPTGHVDAHDIRAQALRELEIRATRAKLANIAILSAPPSQSYDGVLVDAPCSGSGTWRRSPHLKWTTTPAQVAEAATTQLTLLARFATLVRPGGRLVYATCSLSRLENEDVVTAFLAAHPDFTAEPATRNFSCTPRAAGLAILPATHNTDGFYVATLRRR